MSFNEGHAISRNRYWGRNLGWTSYAPAICDQILNIPPCDSGSAAFARGIYAWQEEQVRMLPDGIVGPRSWRRMQRILRNASAHLSTLRPGALQCRNAFLFAPAHNGDGYAADATGAFHPAAEMFRQTHRTAAPFLFDNSQPPAARRREIFEALEAAPSGLDTIAYFGHGLTNAMSSAGIRAADIPAFANLIQSKSAGRCKVLLYACSCGAPGGFAQNLSAALSGNQSSLHHTYEVYAHTHPGHAFRNPTKIVYPEGRYFFVPYTRPFAKWRRALTTNALWARYPFMDEADIQAAVI